MENINIRLPVLNQKNKKISELVMLILTQEWPLSSKGLFKRINRSHARDVSFQGVHKAVKKLFSEEILVKVDNYYKLNPQWLNRIGEFSAQMTSNYQENKTRLKDIP